MLCWWARRRMAESIEGDRLSAAGLLFQRHVKACVSCEDELESARRISRLVAETADSPEIPEQVLAASFEDRVLIAARARLRANGERRWALSLNPTAVMTAASLMMLAGMIAFSLSGTRDGARDLAASRHTTASLDPLEDRIEPPEIPFTIREDLVGIRRGRMPVTTYVLDPPPSEGTVVRASF